MNRHLIYLTIIGAILLLGLVFVGIFLHDYSVDDKKYSHNPVNISSYEINGYYKINPNSILDSLERNESHIFLPLQEDPFTTEELSNLNISWNQADYLQIANALSSFVWKEPLDFNDWKVYSLHFRISCQSTGFDYGEITYFKTYNVNWRQGYTTRHIEIDPYLGIVRWGSDESYPQPILFYKWNDFDLTTSKITAEEALKIANINGGEIARLKEENNCYINLRSPASFQSNNDSWSIDIISNQLIFEVYINPYTGKIEDQE